MSLTPKERVLTALEHRQPDRVPLDIGGTFTSAINVHAYRNLSQHLGLDLPAQIIREQTQSVTVPEELRQRLGIDVVGIYERAPVLLLEKPDEHGVLVNEWGVRYRRECSGHYTLITSPLRDATLDDLENYAWPDPLAASRFAGLPEETDALRESDYAVAGNLGWSEIFGMAWYLRGFEQFAVDLAQDQDMAHALLRRVTDYNLARYGRFLEIVGDVLDVVLFCDDIGGQQGLLISPRMYRNMIKPYHAELLAMIKAHCRARIIMHSCGSIMPILDDFIEIGADILNPVQVSAKGMDTIELKRRFGERVVFWGAIDTQHILPYGNPEEVRAEVQRRAGDLGRSGGYVVAPVHVVQADVPPANVLALCDAVHQTGHGFAWTREA